MKSPLQIKSMKNKEKIVVLTAYNYPVAKLMDGIVDIILVGDSGVMVELGKDTTKSATMDEMILFTKAVKNGAKNTLIIGDMPFGSVKDKKGALKNAKLFLKAGAHAVKIEGNKKEIINHLIKNKIPVMGHIGLLPQTAKVYKVQGKTDKDKERLLREAIELEKAGVFCLVIECVPFELGKQITESLKIPTIGIGAGPYCNGQVLVSNDILGMYDNFTPKFARKYMDFNKEAKNSILKFTQDVKSKKFPKLSEAFR